MSAYTDFLADPGRTDLWIAELYPYDNSAAAEVTLRVSTDEYATEPTDTPANTPYEARLAEGPSFDTDAAPPGTLGQLPARRGGELVVGLRMGDRDTWRSYDWDGRRATVRHGGYSPKLGRKLTYAEMGVAEYEMELAKFGLDSATIPLRDLARKFEDLLQSRRYMGTDFSLRLGASTFVDFGTPAKCDLTGNLTLEGRLWLDSLATSIRLFVWAGASAYPFDFLINTNGTVRFTASNYSAALTTTAALLTKRWYHFQISRLGTSIRFRWREEGPGTETIEAATASAATGAANVGGVLRLGTGTNPLNGIFDELRLYDYARSADEWRDARSKELSAVEAASANLKLYCRANSTSGTTVTDSSASPANGTISGSTFTWLPSLQGKADLAGKVLPDGFGFVEDANPVLVYEPTRIYQVHSRNAGGSFIDSEGGATITAGTAYTDWLLFLLATTTAAQADTLNCTDGTFVRLGSNPSKPISVTFNGDATGSGYVSTAADIVRRIITTRGKNPLTDPGDLDTASYSALNTANSAVLGLYFTEETTIAEAIRRALGSVGAVGWFGRTDRKHRVKRFAGASGTPVVTLTEKQIISIEPLDPEQPAWEEILTYRPNYSVLTVDQMAAGTISTARQAFLEKAVRTIRRPNNATKTRHKYAGEDRVDTYLTTEADAIVEADRRLALRSQTPRAYRLECTLAGLQLDRMDIVAIDYKDLSAVGAEQTRLGLNGVNFVVLAIGERSPEDKALLTIWRES